MNWKKIILLALLFIIPLSACVAESDVKSVEPTPEQSSISVPEIDSIKDEITDTFSSFCDTSFISVSALNMATTVSIYAPDIALEITNAKNAGIAPANWEEIKSTLIDLSEDTPLMQDTTRLTIYLRSSETGEIYLTVSGNNISFDVFENLDERPVEMTLGQKNALRKAEDYLDFMAFSYSGLVNQLMFEGFTEDEAIFAAENCGADWNEQAAIKAHDYLEFMSFSRKGLIDQLIFEGFTQSQAEYGASSVGY